LGVIAVLPFLDVFPGSQISDPGSNYNKKIRGKFFVVALPFFVTMNFTKIKIILTLNR
jgi:hypothetical protein